MDSIKKSSDFKLVAQGGSKWISDSFIIQILKRKDGSSDPSRFGLIVSKKIGNAVRRNFVKRRFREVVRACISDNISGIDIVMIGRLSSAERSLVQMKSDMAWSLKRLGIVE